MASEGSNAGLYILVTFLIILVVGAMLYFGGVFNRTEKKEVDINIKGPSVILRVS